MTAALRRRIRVLEAGPAPEVPAYAVCIAHVPPGYRGDVLRALGVRPPPGALVLIVSLADPALSAPRLWTGGTIADQPC